MSKPAIPRPITPAQRRAAVMIDAGVMSYVAAARCGLTNGRMVGVRHRLAQERGYRDEVATHRASLQKRAVGMHRSGMPIPAIAGELGMTRPNATRLIVEATGEVPREMRPKVRAAEAEAAA